MIICSDHVCLLPLGKDKNTLQISLIITFNQKNNIISMCIMIYEETLEHLTLAAGRYKKTRAGENWTFSSCRLCALVSELYQRVVTEPWKGE